MPTTSEPSPTIDPIDYYANPSRWDTASSNYDDAVGRSSRRSASPLIALADSLLPLNTPSARVLEFAAGTGSLTHTLAAQFPKLPILATDISPGMIATLQTIRSEICKANGTNIEDDTVSTLILDMADPTTPSTPSTPEGSFSHIFSTMAIQVLPSPSSVDGTLHAWRRLLRPEGVVAIGVWDFDQPCGPHDIWKESALAVDPNYINPPLVPDRHWIGSKDLVAGLKEVGFKDVKAEVCQVGFDVGLEGFMEWFWRSENPMTLHRRESFGGDLEKVRSVMRELLVEKYDGGRKIPLAVGLAVGRK